MRRRPKGLPPEERIPIEPTLVWKAKHTKVPLEDKIVQVKCLGKIHKIRFRFPGCITLLNHPDKRGEITMMKLGGAKPECLTYLEQWGQDDYVAREFAFSRPIVKQFLQARIDWNLKRRQIRNGYTDHLLKDIKTRLLGRIGDIHETLVYRITKLWQTNEEKAYEQRFSYSRLNEPEPYQFIRPIINLRFQDLINHKEAREDEASD